MVVSMERWNGKVAVVTGASSGIGAGVAKKLVEEGLLVVGIARRQERIEDLAKSLSGKRGKLYSYKVDMGNEDEIKEAFKWITSSVGPVSILVNSAGCHVNTGLVDGITDAWKTTINVNLVGLCIATREAVNIMRKNSIDGHIVHINSILGHKVSDIAKTNIYPATKHGVTAVSEVLRNELNALNSKIKVTSISPGLVDTELLDSVRNESYFPELQKCMLKSEDVADAVAFALSTPPLVQIYELVIKPLGEKL